MVIGFLLQESSSWDSANNFFSENKCAKCTIVKLNFTLTYTHPIEHWEEGEGDADYLDR
jgi:hypothetical protein